MIWACEQKIPFKRIRPGPSTQGWRRPPILPGYLLRDIGKKPYWRRWARGTIPANVPCPSHVDHITATSQGKRDPPQHSSGSPWCIRPWNLQLAPDLHCVDLPLKDSLMAILLLGVECLLRGLGGTAERPLNVSTY